MQRQLFMRSSLFVDALCTELLGFLFYGSSFSPFCGIPFDEKAASASIIYWSFDGAHGMNT